MASYCVSRNSVDLAIEPVMLCKLCLQECPRHHLFQLTECKCLFCETCMRQYVAVMIAEGMVEHITCPDAQCKKQPKLTVKEIEKLVDKQAFLRFKRLHFQREVDLDPNRTFCPEIGCETVCHVCSHSGGEGSSALASLAKPVMCPTCGLQFCSICKSKWHAPNSCDEEIMNVPKEEAGIPYTNAEDAKIKRCPVCHDDFLLRHYDKGPCKNKLGHSRASVIWHRTQVVGIFAGFGVLLIVASPFLLLAAPCILCCKCKMCRCCDEDDT
ncbi:E3 ubiquitin-protein ligase rnf144a [Plakobranchus ocellatus]|uniref:RBR-type E3 ubiquitin transferase n=1 Tax=Plakobranchus ocellatus TaxID=259542 RepID=A0AAV4BI53_9GAST|nr:E3 ubiquitin-protein ligase rnf144a [Plakobranchus ocellatus]